MLTPPCMLNAAHLRTLCVRHIVVVFDCISGLNPMCHTACCKKQHARLCACIVQPAFACSAHLSVCVCVCLCVHTEALKAAAATAREVAQFDDQNLHKLVVDESKLNLALIKRVYVLRETGRTEVVSLTADKHTALCNA